MARRKRVYTKKWKVDTKYGNILVGRFIGNIMKDGKRSVAEKIIYDCFDIIHEKTKKGGLNILEQALKNVAPLMELKSKRVGGANYQVPIPVVGERRTTLAIRWLKAAINAKKGKRMAEKLADEESFPSTKQCLFKYSKLSIIFNLLKIYNKL